MTHEPGSARRQLDDLFSAAAVEREETTDRERHHAPLIQIHESQVHGDVAVAEQMTVHMHAPVTQVHAARYIEKTVVEVKRDDSHISDDQARQLHALIKTAVTTEARLKRNPRTAQALWGALNQHCHVPQYRLIRREDFGKAQSFLRQWIGRLDAMASAPVKNGDAWRQRKIAYIEINCRIDPAIIQGYITRNIGDFRLHDLDNAQLERVYRYVAGRKPRPSRPRREHGTP